MDDDDAGIDPAIAAQMGFSSFGAKGTTTKRKYHDASFVEGQEDRETKQKKHAGSGANNVVLGARNRTEKIDITGDTSSEQVQDQPSSGSASGDTQGLQGKTQSSAKKEKTAPPSGLAAFLSRGQTMAEPPKTAVASNSAATQVQPEIPAAINAAVPAPAQPMATTARNSGASRTNRSQQSHRHGVRNEQGDMVYFLPSFLEDPWKELRTAAG